MRAPTTNSRRKGFSLVELLAVIAIISVMAAVIGLSLPDNTSANLKSGQSAAIGMFQAARTVASMRRTQARVIIYADNSGAGLEAEKKYLRYMGVVYWVDANEDGDPQDDEWVPANSGVYLPAGVFYIPSSGGNISVDEGGTPIRSSDSQEFRTAYPVTAMGTDPNNWYYYTFNSDGSATIPGDVVVFGAGRAESENGTVSDVILQPYQTNGFAIRRFGGVINLDEAGHVESALANQ